MLRAPGARSMTDPSRAPRATIRMALVTIVGVGEHPRLVWVGLLVLGFLILTPGGRHGDRVSKSGGRGRRRHPASRASSAPDVAPRRSPCPHQSLGMAGSVAAFGSAVGRNARCSGRSRIHPLPWRCTSEWNPAHHYLWRCWALGASARSRRAPVCAFHRCRRLVAAFSRFTRVGAPFVARDLSERAAGWRGPVYRYPVARAGLPPRRW